MKKNVVIISERCYPKNSATGALALKFVEFLEKDCDVSLISIQNEKDSADGIFYKGCRLYTLTQWRLCWAQRTQKRAAESKGIKRKFFKLSYTLARCVGRFQSLLFTLDNMWWYQRKAYCLLKKLDHERKIDSIISINMPIEAHISAMKFKKKNPDVIWTCFWADLFATPNQKQNLFIPLEKMRKLEAKINEIANKVLCTDEIYAVLSQKEPENVLKKMTALPYMLKDSILKRDNTAKPSDDGKISCVYMGAFYRNIRNPEYLLKIFADDRNRNFVLHLYSSGNCDDIVDKYIKIAPDKIILHDLLPFEKLDKILADANILVNIDNSISTAVPSKIYELISYRKPVLNIHDKNMASEPMKNYPPALCIERGSDIDTAWNRIETLATSDISEITYEYICRRFERHLESNVKETVIKSVEIDN